jgi:beta-N-acetylhexosaminidase
MEVANMDFEHLKKNPFNLIEEDIDWVKTTFSSLSAEEKLGQVYCDSLSPFVQSRDIKEIIRLLDRSISYGIGGYFRIVSLPTELTIEMSRYLQDNSKIPLLLSADFEFWFGYCLADGTPYQRQLGVAATDDIVMAERMATIAAREGSALGYNWSYSPVVDIDYNFKNPIVNTRSFGSNPERVLAMSRAYIKAMQSEGMAATVKHWPGDGVDERNQHLLTSKNSLEMDKWLDSYGKIYKELFKCGVLTLMSAHISLPAYYNKNNMYKDPRKMLPGSLSKELNIDLLRRDLGFNGLITSDANYMAGFLCHGKREDLIPMEIENGVDIALGCTSEKDIEYLKKGLENGKLSEKRLDEAVIRVLGLKASLGLHKKKKDETLVGSEANAKKVLKNSQHMHWATECIEKSVTLVKDTQNILPISSIKHKRILLIEGKVNAFMGLPEKLGLKKYLEAEGFIVKELCTLKDLEIDKSNFDLIIYAVAEEGNIVKPGISLDWEKLHGNPMNSVLRFWHYVPTIFISFGSPYHLYEVPEVKTYINCYTPIDMTKQAVVKMLVGEKSFKGINPVDPFCGLEEARI